jgi:hypothetical protein
MQKEIGKSKAYKRISVQQAYLYHGDYQCQERHIDGSPFSVQATSYTITHTLPVGTPIYYRVTPEGLRTSNTVTAYPQAATDIPHTTLPTASSSKLLHNGRMYILRENKKYDVLGRAHEL